ncbi:MAG: hypothetical protein JWO60_1039 [Frankiales bacterium]|nr:hypothetical protein [Frankiales bacterium]
MTGQDSDRSDGGADPRYRAFVEGAPLAYVSDYLSFVGADATGRVCFALDTNRGYDADPPPAKGLRAERLQAEHAYAVLHDEHAGWVPQQGVQRYAHPGPDAAALPDSDWSSWTGTADTGWTVTSVPNDLRLVVEPLADRMSSTADGTFFVMRSAAAVLHWRDRALRGRVIHEGLASTTSNLLSRRTFQGLAGLEFLYLSAGDPAAATGDVYLQKTVGGGTTWAGMPALTGYATTSTADGTVVDGGLQDLTLATTGHAPALGLYRWPTRWEGGWTAAGPDAVAPAARVRLRTVSRTVVGAYGIAGFGMSVLSGTLTTADGTQLPLYGFGELLAAGPLLHALARRGPRHGPAA